MIEFSVNRKTLELELSQLTAIATKKDQLPVLTGILFTVSDSLLLLTASDLEITLQTGVDAEVATTGSVILRAKQILDIIKNLEGEGETVLFAPIPFDNRLLVSCGSSQFRVPIIEDSFPALPSDSSTKKCDLIQSKALASMIAQALIAVPAIQVNVAAPGALLWLDGGVVTLEATDGHRLSSTRWRSEVSDDSASQYAIPYRALEVLRHLVAAAEADEVAIYQSGNQIYFQFDRKLFTATQLGVPLPPCRNVLSRFADVKSSITLDVKQLQRRIRRVSLMTAKATDGIHLDFGSAILKLSASDSNLGDAEILMPIEYEGPPISLRLNAGFLTDFLAVAGVETVTMEIGDPAASTWIAKTETVECRYLITSMIRNGPEPEPEPVKPKPKAKEPVEKTEPKKKKVDKKRTVVVI